MADTYTVERRRTIAAPADRVYLLLVDFQQWLRWSPWEGIDPDLKRAYGGAESGVGATYAWSGNRKAGAGRMEVTDVEENRRVNIDLVFEKPFKSHTKQTFLVNPVGDDQTEVVWTMVGPRPWFMKVFGFMFNMDKMVGGDFEKGLAQLGEAAHPTPAG